MRQYLKTILKQETAAERRERMVPAAVSGALVATAYVWAFFLTNVYTFPGLPLAMDWGQLLRMWLGFALALALFGAIAAWFTEEYAGIVGGGLLFTGLLAIVFLFSASARSGTLTVQAIIMALTLAGLNMLAALGLRWTAHRYLAIKRDEKPDRRRRSLTRHILTLLLIGLVPGVFMRMDSPSVQTLTRLDTLLETAPGDPSVWPQLPLKKVPALQEHFGVDYRLYVRQSPLSAGALDVTVRFADGFSMACFLPVGSGNNFITQCNEGEEVIASP